MNSTASPVLTFRSDSEPLFSYMAYIARNLVQCSKERIYHQHTLLPSLPKFVKAIFKKCRLSPAVTVVGLIYLERLKKNLPNGAKGEYDTPYKLFLAAMILATKYIEDHSDHAVYIYRAVSPIYTPQELNEMERSFLNILKVRKYHVKGNLLN
ncbi:cyclin domain-containing protein [Rhizopus microsporus var. microsporus]|uniref:Cyclin domain-containing protein n=1 Tax=Rhizopus microsporus var. microsporus TaxID=86635 RepID=A0A1X0R705_RHIZD|nr:cyclin domain-containing protein [Rhizopus microsporus var. microsporus]